VRIAVSGAGGRLGGVVVQLLAAGGRHDVVALARRPLADAVVADYDDKGALRAALRGVDTLVFVTSDGEAARVLVHHENVIGAAAESGVAHVVLLSGLDADVSSPFCYAHTAGRTEQLLRESGCGFSIARASIYSEFFLRWPDAARATGRIRLPAGDARMSLVSRDDVGRCLAALAVGAPTGGHHDITGPEALDVATTAAIAAERWGIPIEYDDVTPADYAAETAAAGEDPWWLYVFASMFASVREGRWAAVSDAVRELTGRAPTQFAELLAP